MVGVEQIAWENPRGDQRVTVECARTSQEHFYGRGHSELWEPLSGSPAAARPTRPSAAPCRMPASDYGNDCDGNTPTALRTRASPTSRPTPASAATLGLNIQVGKYIRFRGLFGLTIDMPHFITAASAGVDKNGRRRVELDQSRTRRTRPTASRSTSPAAASASRGRRSGAVRRRLADVLAAEARNPS